MSSVVTRLLTRVDTLLLGDPDNMPGQVLLRGCAWCAILGAAAFGLLSLSGGGLTRFGWVVWGAVAVALAVVFLRRISKMKP